MMKLAQIRAVYYSTKCNYIIMLPTYYDMTICHKFSLFVLTGVGFEPTSLIKHAVLFIHHYRFGLAFAIRLLHNYNVL
jgi:hypothetical protein